MGKKNPDTSGARKFARKLDAYCGALSTLDVVASVSGIAKEELQAIRTGKKLITEPQKKRVLDYFPNVKRF